MNWGSFKNCGRLAAMNGKFKKYIAPNIVAFLFCSSLVNMPFVFAAPANLSENLQKTSKSIPHEETYLEHVRNHPEEDEVSVLLSAKYNLRLSDVAALREQYDNLGVQGEKDFTASLIAISLKYTIQENVLASLLIDEKSLQGTSHSRR